MRSIEKPEGKKSPPRKGGRNLGGTKRVTLRALLGKGGETREGTSFHYLIQNILQVGMKCQEVYQKISKISKISNPFPLPVCPGSEVRGRACGKRVNIVENL
ncbi:hypothetical protein [Spirochaeta thermophila]|uniref:hypothetical protein n=1 Tax=Winmispira thermophila TaxID=154 RepID=UPI0011D15FB4|nr:hypothetical protein [Spirochaeta thermophila]